MNIIVLCGGLSNEREVSLRSGNNVSNALLELNHNVIQLDISFNLEKKHIKKLFKNKFTTYIKKSNKEIGNNVIEACKEADIVFLALHGGIGENGTIQALFDVNNIKYTGTGKLGSTIAMDKDIAKKIMIANNIKTPKWSTSIEKFDFSFPCVLKPLNSGSSIDVKIIDNIEDLLFEFKENMLIEEYISGREFSVGILNDTPLPIIEIKPKDSFYDYDNKYIKGLAEEICPANVNEKLTKKMQNIASKIHKELKLHNYSRIDFIVDKKNNIYCLEANTLPGMTETSLLPQEANAAGIDFKELCKLIIE